MRGKCGKARRADQTDKEGCDEQAGKEDLEDGAA